MMSGKIQKVCLRDEDYPVMLRYVRNPPETLYYRGNIELASQLSISVVGTRKATRYGSNMAKALAEKLAEHDVVITSGLAAGVDTCAHRGALSRNGKTIAVLGCGVDICTPVSNHKLMEEIAERGLLISEYPEGFHATAYTFPQRNRIISGISAATVVVEAGHSSGALITAERAAEQGREVYAIPGNIDSAHSLGANRLIKEGALPLVVLSDILDDLGIQRKETQRMIRGLGHAEKEIFHYIEEAGESTVDSLCRTAQKTPSEINGILSVLEIKGMVYMHLGKIFIAK